MRNWLIGMFLPLFLALLVAAQKPVEITPEQAATYTASFKAAHEAHKAGKYDEAIAGFTKCLTILPEDRVSAYNIACGHSLKGELDAAFEWLDKAVAFGFGETNIESDELGLIEKTDTDLAAMRADPRFEKVLATVKTRAKTLEEYVNRQVVYVPAALEGAAQVPVLVLLHPMGTNRDALLQSDWKSVSDELGLALILPSAREPLAHDPQKGMTWFSNFQAYLQAPFKYEKTISDALKDFKKTHKLDEQRVFIAGEGQGGSVAFNVAIGSPGLYKGVLVFDAPALFQLATSKAPNAAKMGFRGKLFENKAGIYGIPEGTDINRVVEELAKGFASIKLDKVSVAAYALDAAKPTLRKQLALDTLREYMAPKPVETGAGK